MKKEILSSGIADYYGSFFNKLLVSSASIQKIPLKLRDFLLSFVENLFYRPLEKHFSNDTLEELSGLTDATGVKKETILRAVVAPDIMQLLISGFFRGGKKGNGNYYLGGCSAAYARDTAVRGRGRALLARNLDFPGAIVWRKPTIIFHHPSERITVPLSDGRGGWVFAEKVKQPYMYISTAGFPGTGLTGMNKSGITMSTFITLSRESSRNRMPSLDFNHTLFTGLEDLHALPALLKKLKIGSAVPHTVLFADREKAVALETSAGRSFIREMTPGFDTLVQTNHFLSPLMKKGEIEFPLERESTIERYRFLRDALELYHGKLDPGKMVDIISSGYDRFTGRSSLTAVNSPARSNTLMSVVLEPESGNFWVAEGKPPGVCFNTYRGFNVYSEISENRSEKHISDIRPSKTPLFSGHASEGTPRGGRESLVYYTLSKEAMKIGKTERAIRLLRQAIGICDDPGYLYILPILLIRNNQPDEALDIIKLIKKKFRYSPIRESVIPLWEGRCYDLTDRREEAVECYRRGLDRGGLIHEYAQAYRRALKRKFTLKQFPRTLNFNNPDPVNL